MAQVLLSKESQSKKKVQEYLLCGEQQLSAGTQSLPGTAIGANPSMEKRSLAARRFGSSRRPPTIRQHLIQLVRRLTKPQRRLRLTFSGDLGIRNEYSWHLLALKMSA